jgi:hypothetical protein
MKVTATKMKRMSMTRKKPLTADTQITARNQGLHRETQAANR